MIRKITDPLLKINEQFLGSEGIEGIEGIQEHKIRQWMALFPGKMEGKKDKKKRGMWEETDKMDEG